MRRPERGFAVAKFVFWIQPEMLSAPLHSMRRIESCDAQNEKGVR
jgi:hypothetical protein